MSDVFVSYARPQRARVDKLVAALREIEFDVWFDRELTPGQEFPEEIQKQAEASRAMIVCWTPDAVRSPWVLREAEIGRSAEKLVPVFLGDCDLPYPFDRLHTIDLKRWTGSDHESRFDELLARLEALTGKTGRTAAWNAVVGGRSNELVTRVRRELVRLARLKGTTSYPLMAALMGLHDQPTLWAALDACAEENRSRREPPLCALVISDKTERPGKGYFQKHAFLRDDNDPLAQIVWEGHRDRVWAHAWTDD